MYRKMQCQLISPSQSHALGFIKVNIYALFCVLHYVVYLLTGIIHILGHSPCHFD